MAKRRRRKVIGVIAPERWYTTEGAWRYAGMGHSTLKEAREQKIVTPRYKNGRAYFKGAELIAWIETGSTTP